MVPGTHGTTYAANPLAWRPVFAVFDRISPAGISHEHVREIIDSKFLRRLPSPERMEFPDLQSRMCAVRALDWS